MAKYNGHKNYNFWNVALWIANDEGLYRFALDCLRTTKNRKEAAKLFIEHMPKKTPDGAPYSFSSVMSGMSGLE
jgi:hypothetical protein